METSDFTLVDGGLVDPTIADSTGHLWTLEYSNGRQMVQLRASEATSDFVKIVRRAPEVGPAKIAGIAVTLRRGEGEPSDNIPPSVGAEWMDGDVFMTFGGGALTEVTVRKLLPDLRRVSRTEWEAAVSARP
ncbi:MAG TPA: hypothetical protein VG455_10390 [Acidimicrobiales bacterium]|nr:hypothetical protein [Acidimicrobiales bacterium]